MFGLYMNNWEFEMCDFENINTESERIKILMEQYKLLEERRKTFGNQFMQIIGFVIAISALTLGVFGGKNIYLLSIAMIATGATFFIIAYLGRRLGERQDDCENELEKIEELLTGMLTSNIASLPKGAGAEKTGARKVMVYSLRITGLILIIASLIIIFNNLRISA